MGWMLGAGLGLLLGGPLGAVVGGVLQHVMGRNIERMGDEYPPGIHDHRAEFVTYLVSIMTKVAMADGRVCEREMRAMHAFFERELGYAGDDLRYIDGLIRETQSVNPDLGTVARSFKGLVSHEGCLLLLDICYQIAMADGIISVPEQRALGFISETLGIPKTEHERMQYKYLGYTGGYNEGHAEKAHTPEKDDYAVLGVKSSASNDEVKKAYRQMASQYHPDKVSHLGKELIDFANGKFLEINKAYENIKRKRKL